MDEAMKQPHWDAGLYKSNSLKLQYAQALKLIEKLEFKSGDSLLDLGCGDGKITAYIAQRVPQCAVQGIDLSSAMIDLARKEYGHLGCVCFTLASVENFVAPEPVDWVVSFFCLQWVKDKRSAFRNIARSLKAGGRAALIMTDRNRYLLAQRNRLIGGKSWQPYFMHYEDVTSAIDDDNYVEYALDAGFAVTEYKQHVEDIFFASDEELQTFIDMVTPAKGYLPTFELQRSFIAELTAAYRDAIPARNGGKRYVSYTVKTLLAGPPPLL